MTEDQIYKKAPGPVEIIGGKFKGRIGYYDNDIWEKPYKAVVYFGDITYIAIKGYYAISHNYVIEATTDALLKRRNNITSKLMQKEILKDERITLLEELNYIDNVISNNYIKAITQNSDSKFNFFISHSSKNKAFAKILSTDLINKGHSVWLDEWVIKVGESIPQKISEGLDKSDYLVIILSKDAVNSRWVENEWQSKYWDEVNEKDVKVLPILLEDCKIPRLLKSKKYADFRMDYQTGFSLLYSAIKSN